MYSHVTQDGIYIGCSPVRRLVLDGLHIRQVFVSYRRPQTVTLAIVGLSNADLARFRCYHTRSHVAQYIIILGRNLVGYLVFRS